MEYLINLFCCVLLSWSISRTEAACTLPSHFLPAGPAHGDRQDLTAQLNQALPLPSPINAGSTQLDSMQFVKSQGQVKFLGVGQSLYIHPADTSSYNTVDNVDSYLWDRITTDSAVLKRVTFLVNQAHNMNTLSPSFVYISTWLCLTGAGMGSFASFQVAVASDGTSTYLIASYDSELPAAAQYRVNNNGNFLDLLPSNPSTQLVTQTNACQLGQWVWQLTSTLDPPLNTPPCTDSLSEWTDWAGSCTVCGGCGQRSRTRQSYFGGEEIEVGCPAKKCKIGIHPKGEWIISKRHRWIRRNRRCCYDFRYNQPKLMPFPRRCFARKCQGWEI